MASAGQEPGLIHKIRDKKADQFIVAACRFGFSIPLIQKVLKESNYNPSQEEIRMVLSNNGIYDYDMNCSHIWKRYLSYIAEKFDPPSLDKFKDEGLKEATTFYGINEEIFINYWIDLCDFHSYAPIGYYEYGNFDEKYGPWFVGAFLDFGYNHDSLIDYLKRNGFNINRNDLDSLFKHALSSTNRDEETVKNIAPKLKHSEAAGNFMTASYELLGDAGIPKIIEMTEIFDGCRVKPHTIKLAILTSN